jgi:hypothetical protein
LLPLLGMIAGGLAAAGSAGATVWESVPVGVERDGPAYCLRATGTDGELRVATPTRSGKGLATRLLRADRGGGLARDPRAPAAFDDCAAVATAASGAAIAAGPGGRRRGGAAEIRAVVQDPGRPPARPARLGPTGIREPHVAAAIGADGTAVVAWIQSREPSGDGDFDDGEQRVLAARRRAGGGFGPVGALTGWRRGSDAQLAAAVDGDGGVLLAWAVTDDPTHGIPDASRVEAVRAGRGGPFGPVQRLLRRRVDSVERVALAVAPDGRALLAFDGDEMVRIYEAAPSAPFAPGAEIRGAGLPAVAIRDGGGAAVSWRDGGGAHGAIRVRTRESAGAFGPTQTVTAIRRREALAETFSVVVTLGAFEEAGPGPEVAVGADGRVVLAWIDGRRAPDGDLVPSARVAAGTLGAGVGRAAWLGSRCRAAEGVAALLLAGGEPAAAYSDNTSYGRLTRGERETAWALGRIHVARPFGGPAAAPARAPAVRLRARPQSPFRDQPLEVEAACDGPCDLRAVVPGRLPLGSATLRRAGKVTLSLQPGFDRPWTAYGARVPVAVHACSPAGGVVRRARIAVPVSDRPLPPLPRPRGVRARRRGDHVVVRWRTDRPAFRVGFLVEGRPARKGAAVGQGAQRAVVGRGRRRFAVRLQARGVRFVALTQFAADPGRPRRIRVVRVR